MIRAMDARLEDAEVALDSLTVSVGSAKVRILKKGLYRFDAAEGVGFSVKTMNGDARFVLDGVQHSIRKKQSVVFGHDEAELSIRAFKHWDEDELAAWSAKRAVVVARTMPKAGKPKGPNSTMILMEGLPDRRRAGLPNP